MVGLIIRAVRLRAFFKWQSDVLAALQRRTDKVPEQFEPTTKIFGRPKAEWAIFGTGVVSLITLSIALGKLLFIELGW